MLSVQSLSVRLLALAGSEETLEGLRRDDLEIGVRWFGLSSLSPPASAGHW
jgi:hypothetical protein